MVQGRRNSAIICEDRNLKLNPSKLNVSEKFEFWGNIKSHKVVKDEELHKKTMVS